jgi:Ca2+-binding RTX toxin-like protein
MSLFVQPTFLPDLTSYYAEFTGNGGVTIVNVVPVDMTGDGYPEIVIHLQQLQEVFGTQAASPQANRLVILAPDGSGGYIDATNQLIASGGITPPSLAGGSRQHATGDLNGDGRPDIAFATNWEDGRDQSDSTKNATQASVLLSRPDGQYEVLNFDPENWYHAVAVAPADGPLPGISVFAGFVTNPVAYIWADGSYFREDISLPLGAGTLLHIGDLDNHATGARYYFSNLFRPPNSGDIAAVVERDATGNWSVAAEADLFSGLPTKFVEVTSWSGTASPWEFVLLGGEWTSRGGYSGSQIFHLSPGGAPLVAAQHGTMTLLDPNVTSAYESGDPNLVPSVNLRFFAVSDSSISNVDVPISGWDRSANFNHFRVLDLNADGFDDIVVLALGSNTGPQPLVFINDTSGGLFRVDWAPKVGELTPWIFDANSDGRQDFLYLDSFPRPGDPVALPQLYVDDHTSSAGGGSGGHLLLGTIGPDGLVGDIGPDFIHGMSGDDEITGLDGNDEMFGGSGNDSLTGGPGNDSILGGVGDDWVHGNAGDDTIRGSLGNDDLRGGKGNDIMYAGQGSDTLWGALGDDEIRGGLDDDVLTAGQGNDTLSAGQGNDLLQGRLGNDLLYGKLGADTFWFNAAGPSAADTIADFVPGEDRIELDSSLLLSLIGMAGGSPAAGNFLAGVAPVPQNTNQLLLYDTSTGDFYYDPDGSGAAAAELIATLTGAPALSESDIFVS